MIREGRRGGGRRRGVEEGERENDEKRELEENE